MNKLNTSYKIYFHDPNSYNWEKDSYILINSIKKYKIGKFDIKKGDFHSKSSFLQT